MVKYDVNDMLQVPQRQLDQKVTGRHITTSSSIAMTLFAMKGSTSYSLGSTIQVVFIFYKYSNGPVQACHEVDNNEIALTLYPMY